MGHIADSGLCVPLSRLSIDLRERRRPPLASQNAGEHHWAKCVATIG
jgi:hypothetical protein